MQVKPYSLVSINEKEELEAQKQLYMKIEMKMSAARDRKLEKLRKINLIYLPCWLSYLWGFSGQLD